MVGPTSVAVDFGGIDITVLDFTEWAPFFISTPLTCDFSKSASGNLIEISKQTI